MVGWFTVNSQVLPDRMVYFSASWAIMLTRPSNREVMADPRSLRKRDSHTRQYCSPLSRLHHGAWNESRRVSVVGLARDRWMEGFKIQVDYC